MFTRRLTTQLSSVTKLALASITLLVAVCFNANAQSNPWASTSNSSGAYTVTFQPGYYYSWLEEQVGSSGVWQQVGPAVPGATGATTVAFSGKPSGVYYYRTAVIDLICYPPYGCYDVLYYYSGSISVTVNAGPPPAYDDLYSQRDYQYELRYGDVTGDSRLDVYVRRIAGGDPNNGTLLETIVQQQSDGTFAVLSASAAQLSAASYWPVLSVAVELEDVNRDGHIDVITRGLPSLLSGVNDQVIFSTGTTFSGQALAVTAVDVELENFFRDVRAWMADPNYFSAAIMPEVPGYNVTIVFAIDFCSYYYYTCFSFSAGSVNLGDFSLVELGLADIINTQNVVGARYNVDEEASAAQYPYIDYYCVLFCGSAQVFYNYYEFFYYQWWDIWTPVTISGGQFDTNHYSQQAYQFAGLVGSIATFAQNSPGSEQATQVADTLESVLGAGVMGGVLDGAIIEHDVALPPRVLTDDFLGLVLPLTFGAFADEPEGGLEAQCNYLYYEVDTPTCNAITRTRGKSAGAACHASAAQRYAACLRGTPVAALPPLNTWANNEQHPDSSVFDMEYWEEVTGLTGVALIIYLIISEGSRIFPPRNLVPVP